MLGILFVNSADNAGIFFPDLLFPAGLDRMAYHLVYILGKGKFWPLFAVLFGVGFAVQLERAEARKLSIIPVYLRRLFFLALMGYALRSLSIRVPQLEQLALAGVPMLFIGYALRRRPVSWLGAAAAAVLAIHLSFMIPTAMARDRGLSGPPDVDPAEAAVRVEKWRGTIEASADKDASWSLDRLRIGPRLKQTLRYYAGALKLWLRSSFSFYMLLGIFLWRLGVFRDTERHRRLFVSVLAVSLPIGLGIAIFGHYAAQSWNLTQFGLGEYPTALFHILSWPLGIIGNLGMTLTYIAGIALLIQHKLWSRVLGIFAPVGRMALTNYALQGLLPGLVFGTYLIGLPRLRLAFLAHAAVLLTIFGFQILFSRAWLRGYRLGPLEWLWRSLTYWKCQPMRLERSDQAHYEW